MGQLLISNKVPVYKKQLQRSLDAHTHQQGEHGRGHHNNGVSHLYRSNISLGTPQHRRFDSLQVVG